MCRILFVRSDSPVALRDWLLPFADMSKNSPEYQGHGWGCAWYADGQWSIYRNIKPVWEDDLDQFGATTLLLVHARSAFRDEGIVVENNMPFSDGQSVFIFNGELRGVKINSEGRIGAEKIYNYVRRFDHGDQHAALEKATGIIEKRTSYVRAMNIIMSDGQQHSLATLYGENPDYFQMHQKVVNGVHCVCSQPLNSETDWQRIENRQVIPL